MPSNAIHDPNNLLIQEDDGSFTERGATTGIGTTERARGASLADLNGDGLLDIIVVNRRAAMEVWQNTTETDGHWLLLELRQPDSNIHAVGAIVEIRLTDGRLLTQEVTIGGGHASGTAGPLHFGLGTAEVVSARIIWPDGSMSNWEEIRSDQYVVFERAEGGAFQLFEG